MKHHRYLLVSGGLAGLTGLVSAAFAAFDVPWQTMDGGGGVSSATLGSSAWKVTGTIGQSDAHAASSSASSFSFSDGYWAAAVSAPEGAPVLSIARSGANAIVSWSAGAAGYQLQLSPDLSGWSPSGNIISGAGHITVTYEPGTPRQFFRLVHP